MAEAPTPMIGACATGNLQEAERLHARGDSIELADELGQTPIHYACTNGHLEVAKWLHSMGAAINVAAGDGRQPIHDACSAGHPSVVQWLHSQGASLDAETNNKVLPIHTACSSGHVDIAKWLHSHGADVNVVTAPKLHGQAPIHIACLIGDLELSKWLASQGASIHKEDNDGWQPVHYACMKGHLEVVKWLHSEGALLDVETFPELVSTWEMPRWKKNPNDPVKPTPVLHTSMQVSTPLMLAKKYGHKPLVKWLKGRPDKVAGAAAQANAASEADILGAAAQANAASEADVLVVKSEFDEADYAELRRHYCEPYEEHDAPTLDGTNGARLRHKRKRPARIESPEYKAVRMTFKQLDRDGDRAGAYRLLRLLRDHEVRR